MGSVTNRSGTKGRVRSDERTTKGGVRADVTASSPTGLSTRGFDLLTTGALFVKDAIAVATRWLIEKTGEGVVKAAGGFVVGAAVVAVGASFAPLIPGQVSSVPYIAGQNEWEATATGTPNPVTIAHKVYDYQIDWRENGDSVTATVTELGNETFRWGVDAKINGAWVAGRYKSEIENGQGIGTLLLRRDEHSKLLVGWREGAECVDKCNTRYMTRCPIVIGPVERRDEILQHEHLHRRCEIVAD